ncbi:MAG: hypothetical protein H7338_12200 [Candidatus Sericytochromatia bacterium]|nr:hypothetical protein [Candidatus Sericytochromatia bacterium]
MKSLVIALFVAVGIFSCLTRPTLKNLLTIRRRPTPPVRALATARRRRS